jgi:TonB family protein
MTTAALDPAELARATARKPLDSEPVPYLGLSAIMHGAFLLLAMIVPPGAAHLELDGASQSNRFVELAATPDQEEPLEPDESAFDEPGGESTAKHAGEEGAAGAEDAEATDKRLAIEGPPDNAEPEVARARDEQIAREAGVNAVFSDKIASTWGTSEASIGSDAISALGNLDGGELGEAKGFGGWGITDTRDGGGGRDRGSFGMDNVDTKGKGGPDGHGDGDYGRDEADLGDPDEHVPQVIADPPEIDGPIDREIIQRVVRQHRREIAYCYESQLQRDPTLEGRVVMKFTIAPTGNVVVARVAESTLDNTAVESCMSAKIRHWDFPAHTTTGLVAVKYPFRFSRK